MKKLLLLLLSFYTQVGLFAQEYFPEGTKWTEIRLDTEKYDSWYSKVDDEWVPNFETIEYHVQGEYAEPMWSYYNTFKKVYTSGPEWTDSLTLMLFESDDCVLASSFAPDYLVAEDDHVLWPAQAYQFDWSVGKGIYYEDILHTNTTDMWRYHYYFGIISEIKEGDFGGVRPLMYVDLNGDAPESKGNIINKNTAGGRVIQGIGITEWNSGECLFGGPNPYVALYGPDNRHYRSMLVHFERNNEVLYDVWPTKSVIDGIKTVNKENTPINNTLYDLQGRRLSDKPSKGIFIQNGKKVVIK
ncbi:hypothetical protein SAMN06298211_10728 [Prevotellaceae bacterium MN60]|nr:hypothetical protein SAMN06298211_10728 [Prevotellaceae bacterium MN60]